jgi:chemotaxis protein MotB
LCPVSLRQPPSPSTLPSNLRHKDELMTRRSTSILASLVLLMFTTGCVTSSKYDILDSAYRQTQAELDEAHTQIGGLKGELNRAANRGSELAGTLSEKERALASLRAQEAQAEQRISQFQELTDKFSSLVDAGKLTVSILNGRMVVHMQTDVLFRSGSARLSPDGRSAVEEVSGLLVSIPDRRYQVEGHTDSVPIQTFAFPTNWELASARAISVVNVMIEKGMPPERVSAVSYGDTTPIALNNSDKGKAQNRRIEIVLVPDLSQLPGFDELQQISASPASPSGL